jgi:fibronectin type 3 domain-containing protein
VATISVSMGAVVDSQSPSRPGNASVVQTGPQSARFGWTSSTDDVGVTGYRVSRDGVVLDTVAGTSYDDGGLAPGTHYEYSVVALDAAGHESSQATAGYTAPSVDATSPTAPGNLRRAHVTRESVRLAWEASHDAVGVVGYRIYRNGKLLATTHSLTWTGKRRTHASTYWVVAFDAAGNVSPRSNSRTVKAR